MQDRYLFRGKVDHIIECDFNPDTFIIGLYCEDAPGFPMITADMLFKYWINVIPETVGQCTGRRDMNGTLIFEGDILSIYGGVDAKGELRRIYYQKLVVSWCNDWNAFVVIDHMLKEQFLLNKFAAIEVVGNIHDNPELINAH